MTALPRDVFRAFWKSDGFFLAAGLSFYVVICVLPFVLLLIAGGGFLLSNNVLVELPTTPLHAIGHNRAIYSDRPDDSDDIVWYRRQ